MLNIVVPRKRVEALHAQVRITGTESGQTIGSHLFEVMKSSVLTQQMIEGTPYAGGYFRVKFMFTEEFPAAPPKCMYPFPPYSRLIHSHLTQAA